MMMYYFLLKSILTITLYPSNLIEIEPSPSKLAYWLAGAAWRDITRLDWNVDEGREEEDEENVKRKGRENPDHHISFEIESYQ
ncbi:hypothetical protein Leryth_014176 [Lithospermum erythrorhizon]|nr:hypothetical protein Leryth_014176 [Lithospermum erythrorhizon]